MTEQTIEKSTLLFKFKIVTARKATKVASQKLYGFVVTWVDCILVMVRRVHVTIQGSGRNIYGGASL